MKQLDGPTVFIQVDFIRHSTQPVGTPQDACRINQTSTRCSRFRGRVAELHEKLRSTLTSRGPNQHRPETTRCSRHVLTFACEFPDMQCRGIRWQKSPKCDAGFTGTTPRKARILQRGSYLSFVEDFQSPPVEKPRHPMQRFQLS